MTLFDPAHFVFEKKEFPWNFNNKNRVFCQNSIVTLGSMSCVLKTLLVLE
jgi:hypothetical protein